VLAGFFSILSRRLSACFTHGGSVWYIRRPYATRL
jgi:hypothetical protein